MKVCPNIHFLSQLVLSFHNVLLLNLYFQYHGTVAQLSGELLRDLADSKILPFNMTDYYLILNQYRVALKNHSLDSLTQYEVNMSKYSNNNYFLYGSGI